MITVNNFEIQENGSQLAIDVQTETGSLITSILLWNINTFKDYSATINLNYKLTQLTNQESFIVTAEELQIASFDDMWFIEIQDNYIPEDNCGQFLDPALAITYNLSPYYKCLLNRFFESQKNPCTNCDNPFIDKLVLSIGLTLDIIEKSIEEGYYLQAIDLIKKLQKFCSIKKCNNCEKVECSSCSKFKQD
jgi:hypothetical protein